MTIYFRCRTGTAHVADMYAPTNTDLPSMSKARLEVVLFLNKIMKKASNADILRNFKHFAYTLYGGSSSSSASSSTSSSTPPPAPKLATTNNNNGKVNPANIQMFAGPTVRNTSSSSTAQSGDNSDSDSSSPSPFNSLSIRKISNIINSNSQASNSNTDTSQKSINPVAPSARSDTGSSATSTANSNTYTNTYTNPSSRSYSHLTTSVTALSRMINDQFTEINPSYPSVSNISSPSTHMQSAILSHLVHGELPSSSAPLPSHTLTDDSITSKGKSSSSVINLNSRYNPIMIDHDPNVQMSERRPGNPEEVRRKEEPAKYVNPTENAENAKQEQEPAEPEHPPTIKPGVPEPNDEQAERERPSGTPEIDKPETQPNRPETITPTHPLTEQEHRSGNLVQAKPAEQEHRPGNPVTGKPDNQLGEQEHRPEQPEHEHTRHGRPMFGERRHAPKHGRHHHHHRRRTNKPNPVQAKNQHKPNTKKHRRHRRGHRKPHIVHAPKMNGNQTETRPTVKTSPMPVKVATTEARPTDKTSPKQVKVNVAATHIIATKTPARPIDKNKKPHSSSTGSSSSGSSTSSSGSSSSSSTKQTKITPVAKK